MAQGRLSPLLEAGEALGDIAPVEHGSQEWAYGYRAIGIQRPYLSRFNSVLLDIQPGGGVAPVLITDQITLSVKALRGHGYAVSTDEVRREKLELTLLDPRAKPLALGTGNAYYFVNGGDEEFVLRDDCTPPFQDGSEELALTAPNSTDKGVDGRSLALPIRFWTTFGILQRTPYESLKLHEQVIEGATYQSNDGIRYKVEKLLEGAEEGWEQTHELTPGTLCTQLDPGDKPAGTQSWRSTEEFLHGAEVIDGRQIPIFRLYSMPITKCNLGLIVPGL